MNGVLPLDHGGPTDRPFEPFAPEAIEQSVPTRFATIARRYADRPALLDRQRRFSYGEVWESVGRLALRLAGAGLIPGTPVGILLGHDALFPIAMLGVLRAGCGYVPLDAGFPAERNRLILAQAGIAALVTDQAHWAQAAGLLAPELPLLVMDDAGVAAPDCALPEATPDSLAYILYTSGTTAAPKGVFQNHRNLLHDVMQYTNAVHLGADDRLTQCYSPSVNGAIRDIYGALLNGASLHILPPGEGVDLAGFVRKRRITIYHSVPVVFRHLVRDLDPGQGFDEVRIVYIAGDRLDGGDVAAFKRHFPLGGWLYTGIGATEAATLYRHRFIGHATPIEPERVPVGHAIPDREMLLLGPEGDPVATGEIGEIHVESRHIALGYWNAPALTAERFVPHPRDPGVRRYRTGDLGRLRPDGLLEFLGRADHQLKIQGHRVEPAAIEAILKTHPGVAEAAVLGRPTPGSGEPRLVGYWTTATAPDAGPDAAALKAFLRERLPPYMVPVRLARIEALPLLPNFKIDRAALAQLDPPAPPETVLPTTPLGWSLKRLWENLLGLDAIGMDDDFFELGGNSLLAFTLVTRITQALGRELPLVALFEHPTLARLARHLEQSAPRVAGGLEPLRAEGRLPPLFFAYGVLGQSLYARPLLPYLDTDRPVYGFKARGFGDGLVPDETLEAMAAYCLGQIRGLQPTGPYHLAGYSFGGRLAFEIARQLRLQSQDVAFLGIIDANAPPPLPGPTPVHGQNDSTGRNRVAARNRAASQRYAAHSYPGTAVLFLSHDWPEERYVLPDAGWAGLVQGGVRHHVLACAHLDLVREPWAAQLGGLLDRCLREGADGGETWAGGDPRWPELWREAAELRRRGDIAGEIAAYRRVLALGQAPSAWVYRDLYLALRAVGDPGADRFGNEAPIHLAQHAPALYLLGKTAMQEGDLALAGRCLEQAIALDPDQPLVRGQLVRLRLRQGRAAEADEHLNGLAGFTLGRSTQLHRWIARLLLDCGHLEGAERHFRHLAGLEPQNPRPQAVLGWTLIRRGCWIEAEECYGRAIALDANFPEAHNGLGHALRPQGRIDEAIAAVRRAVELAPGQSQFQTHLEVLLRQRG
ncbi:amino acid adenylation domain-containing protein [Methylomagnum ishizawai]|uniref:Amino acid adenylation domain-containing protein n=1 Tax=Methylomagnum ishizawai TaxID=1760988 RepID=A0A1Y6CST1_9GAMM|nr:amino acid adenylation domain-containing protein [Methylomagnum ishizawai]SMF93376.1 amino acid adenylation domain-containing protein [Methylomagnum ishizawai]